MAEKLEPPQLPPHKWPEPLKETIVSCIESGLTFQSPRSWDNAMLWAKRAYDAGEAEGRRQALEDMREGRLGAL